MSCTATKKSDTVKQRRFKRALEYFRHLNETEPETFSLVHWIQAEEEEDLREALRTWRSRYRNEEPLNCGTKACVLGHFPNIFPTHFKWRTTGPYAGVAGIDEDEPTAWVAYRLPFEALYGTKEYVEPEPGWVADHLGGTYDQWENIMFAKHYAEDGLVHEVEQHNKRPDDVELIHVLRRMEELYEELYGSDS